MGFHIFNDAAIVFLPNAVVRMVDLAAENLHNERIGGGRRGLAAEEESRERREERRERTYLFQPDCICVPQVSL